VSIRTISTEEEQQLQRACTCKLTGDDLADHATVVSCRVHGLRNR
jgi:hypothetical protein